MAKDLSPGDTVRKPGRGGKSFRITGHFYEGQKRRFHGCQDVSSQCQYLLKRVRLEDDPSCTDDLFTWAQLRHQNILQYLSEYWEDGPHLYMLCETARFCLWTLLERWSPGRPCERLYPIWLYQIASGLDYLHKGNNEGQPILYRNLRPDNILVTENCSLKLCHFATSKRLDEQKGTTGTVLGQDVFHSPELRSARQYNKSTDIWSYGVTAGHIADIRMAKKAGTERKMIRIVQGCGHREAVQQIVQSSLHQKPEHRPSASEILAFLTDTFGSDWAEKSHTPPRDVHPPPLQTCTVSESRHHKKIKPKNPVSAKVPSGQEERPAETKRKVLPGNIVPHEPGLDSEDTSTQTFSPSDSDCLTTQEMATQTSFKEKPKPQLLLVVKKRDRLPDPHRNRITPNNDNAEEEKFPCNTYVVDQDNPHRLQTQVELEHPANRNGDNHPRRRHGDARKSTNRNGDGHSVRHSSSANEASDQTGRANNGGNSTKRLRSRNTDGQRTRMSRSRTRPPQSEQRNSDGSDSETPQDTCVHSDIQRSTLQRPWPNSDISQTEWETEELRQLFKRQKWFVQELGEELFHKIVTVPKRQRQALLNEHALPNTRAILHELSMIKLLDDAVDEETRRTDISRTGPLGTTRTFELGPRLADIPTDELVNPAVLSKVAAAIGSGRGGTSR